MLFLFRNALIEYTTRIPLSGLKAVIENANTHKRSFDLQLALRTSDLSFKWLSSISNSEYFEKVST